MKAVLLRRHGGIDQLEYSENHPVPSIGPDEALIKVKACSINHLDLWVRQGLPTLKLAMPHILGCDVAGEITALGSKTKEWKEGDAVSLSPGISCWECSFCKSGRDNLCRQYAILGEHVPGGYAEFAKVKISQLAAKPRNISFEEAAAYPLTFLTAWHMLATHGRLGPGKSALILGAGSGIGVAAVQIAALLKSNPIIATSSSKEKLKRAIALGATNAIQTDAQNPEGFYREVVKITNREGVDVVFEHIGPATMPDSIRSVKKGGIIVTCGATTGPQAPVDLRYFFTREIRIQGSLMGTLAEMKEVTRLVGEGKLKPVIDSILPLAEAGKAHRKIEGRSVFGKIILVP